MSKLSYIYALIQRNPKVSPNQRLFYVGSSNAVHERVICHVESIFEAKNIERPTEVYGYINSHVGDSKFDVFIIDNQVPQGYETTYERYYYDLLVTYGFQLVNSNKPIPKFSDWQSQVKVINDVANKLTAFISRVFENSEMNTEEVMLNALKRQAIQLCKLKHQDQMKAENEQLKKTNKELREKIVKMKIFTDSLNVKLTNLDDMNKILRANVDLHEKIQSINQSKIPSDVTRVDLEPSITLAKNETIQNCADASDICKETPKTNEIIKLGDLNWLIVTDRFYTNIILKSLTKSPMKLVAINNYLHAKPRLGKIVCTELDQRNMYVDDDESVIYIRLKDMSNPIIPCNGGGFYESILNLLKSKGVNKFIYITDVWPPPTPRNLVKNDQLNTVKLFEMCEKVIVNMSEPQGANDLKSNDKFVDMTKNLGLDKNIQRRAVLSPPQQLIFKTLNVKTDDVCADELHLHMFDNSDNVKSTRKYLTRMFDKGLVSRYKEFDVGNFKYFVSQKNIDAYNDLYGKK